ncbi:MAG: hypothetical protein QM488_18340 [Rhizobiaceae bacterium]
MPIKKVPFDYVHPKKKLSDDSSEKSPVPTRSEHVQQVTISILPARVVQPDETISVRLLASFPSPGVSAEFDEMIGDNISPKIATLALLKKGSSLLETEGGIKAISGEDVHYLNEGDYAETVRSIRRSTYDWAKSQYDPHDILSARALGAKLGNAILGYYFSRF